MRHAIDRLPRPTPRPAGGLALALAFAVAAAAAAAWPAHAGVNFWTPLGPDGGSIDTLAASPAQPGLLYATSLAGLFRSADGGATWARMSRGLEGFVSGVVADPQSAATVYVIGELGLARSVDGAATWSLLGQLPGSDALLGGPALAIDPQSPATMYGGGYLFVWKSVDAGATWTKLPAAGRSFATVAVDPGNPSTVFAVDNLDGVVLRSTDGGATWEEKDTGLSFAGFSYSDPPPQLAFDLSTVPETSYLAFRNDHGDGVTWRSTDGGNSWQPAGPGGYPLAVGQGVVYAGATKSVDGGVTWDAAAAPPGTPVALAAAPGSAATVYAATSDRGIWKSADAAASWQPASSGLGATKTLALAIDSLHPRILYSVVQGGVLGPGLLKTGSGGRQWHLVGPPWLVRYLGQITVDPVTPTTLYAGSPVGLAKSLDGGNDWEVLPTQAGPRQECFGVDQLAIDPVAPETLYAVASTGYVSSCPGSCATVKSTDGGNSWSCWSAPFVVERLFAAPGALYAFGAFTSSHGRQLGALFKSADGGATWTDISAGLHTNGGRDVGFFTLAIDPADANTVFVSELQGVFRTTDGGRAWTEADGKPSVHSLGQNVAINLVIDPHHPATVYASDSWGVYRTTNGGRAWYPIVGGLPPFAFQSTSYPSDAGVLVIDPQQAGKIYGGTLATGIYTYTAQ
ncbi:MAG TPA: hypothetical protein VN999_13460 [Thermoanaerobaculia bacterium]|nr:hypothetical protein [Thermoanaerobaculia bacterium]